MARCGWKALAGNLSTDDGKYDSLFGEVGNIFPCQVQPELGGGRIGEKAESGRTCGGCPGRMGWTEDDFHEKLHGSATTLDPSSDKALMITQKKRANCSSNSIFW